MRPKIGIRRKIVLYICVATSLVVIVGLGSGYFFGYKLLRDTLGEDHVKMAENIAVSVSGLLERVIENIVTHTTNPMHRNAILERESKYINKNPAEIKEYFSSMDKQWAEADADSLLVKDYMAGESAQRLKKYTLEDKSISEIFTTDSFGGLTAASGKTSDFYQADEEWWSAAYNDGKGAVYFGKIEYDESSGKMALPMAAPVRGEKGEVIGVLKAVLNVEVLFETLENFKIGKTGHAVLVDKNGFIIYHRGIKPLSVKLCGNEEFAGLVDDPKRWAILADPHAHKKEMFTAFAFIDCSLLSERGIIWRIFVDREARETFSAIDRLFAQMGLAAVIIILVLLPTAFIFSGVFVKPIAKLRDAVEHIGKGELDYPIEVKTGDEIEGFADSFRSMIDNLKKITVSRDELNKEITEREKVEQSLRDSGEKFKAIYESSNDAIMLLTEKGFFDCNQRTLELFGYKNKDEFFKVHPADISPPTQPNGQDSFSLSMERIKTAYNEGVNSFEWVHCSRDGTVFPANVLLTAFEYGGKRVLQATVRDLSESKKMEEVRRLAQLGELVSSIAHEVNNPLMIISGNAQLCQMEDLKNDSVKENLKMIVDQCERAKSIIHRMLVFSRPGKGQIKEMDINENLEFVTELVEHQYSLANVRIIRDFSASLPKVRADEKQMQEVFLNLIRNAAEAMPDGGTLTLTTALEDGFVRLEFIDTGAGMSGEVMDKIFYPFFSTKELGVGLGLSVSQSIIKIHGGEIKFKSKPGEGTVATVLLPIT